MAGGNFRKGNSPTIIGNCRHICNRYRRSIAAADAAVFGIMAQRKLCAWQRVPIQIDLCECQFRKITLYRWNREIDCLGIGNSLVAVAKERFPARTEFDSAKALDEYAAAGDADARAVLDTAAAYNASGIANMIQLYAPEVIIFGGGQCRADGYLFTKTLEELCSILPGKRLDSIHMEISTLGKYQSALGAARLAFESDFGDNKNM